MSTAAEPARPQIRKRRQTGLRRISKRIGRLIKWQLVLVSVLLILTIPSAVIIVLASDSYARVEYSLASVTRVVQNVGQQTANQLSMADFDRLQASVQNLSDSLATAKAQNSLLARLAFANADLKTTFQMLDAASQMTQAGGSMLNGLQPTLFFMTQGNTGGSTGAPSISSGERVIELLQTGQGQFTVAQRQLTTAQQILDGIDSNNVSPQLLLQLQQLRQYQSQLVSLNTLLINSPNALSSIFGVNTPRNYLVLSQNNDELRPSGGYISTFGWLRVRRFRIDDFGYGPTTATSPNPPPDSLGNDIHVPSWWFQDFTPLASAWDESWYADFPSTAQMAAWYYDNGDNPRSPVDGVIAIDLLGFKEILRSLGSVSVPDYNVVVNADNFRDMVYQIRNSTDQHKEFLAATYQAVFDQWQSIDQSHSQALLGAILTALREKHVVVYFKDPALNSVVDALGFSGAQTPGTADYLMVADANLGNKSNSSVVRQLTYDVAVQPDSSLQCRLTVSYDYSAALADKDPAVKPEDYGNQKDYFNLMQVYTPKGITLTGTDNLTAALNVVPGSAMTILATGVRVNFDTSERYQFSYTTPAIIEAQGRYKHYRLLVQKQLGTVGDTVNVQITLPVGSKVVSTSPDPAANYTLDSPILEYQLQLTTDQWIDVIYQ
jgi:hypothetical protein